MSLSLPSRMASRSSSRSCWMASVSGICISGSLVYEPSFSHRSTPVGLPPQEVRTDAPQARH
jgi:hypothetical protein